MRRFAHWVPLAVFALVLVTMLVSCGGKGGGY
jgi:hypothetical protein